MVFGCKITSILSILQILSMKNGISLVFFNMSNYLCTIIYQLLPLS